MAVFGKEVRTLTQSALYGDDQSDFVYLGSRLIAECHKRDGENSYMIFSKSVTHDDYRTFLAQIKQSAGTDLGSNPVRPLPEQLIAEAKAVSEKILASSVSECTQRLDRATGELVGTVKFTYIQGGYSSTSVCFIGDMTEKSKEAIFGTLTRGAEPVFDSSLTRYSESNGSSRYEAYYLGAQEIASNLHNHNSGQTSCNICGHQVTKAEYKEFVEQVKALLERKGVEQKSELPTGMLDEFSRWKMNLAVSEAQVVPAGWRQLKGIYGASHFGSGGGYGSVEAYVLKDWLKGVKTPARLEANSANDGFTSGPNAVNIQEGTIVLARGGDGIGQGRSWHEIYVCGPKP